jgi:hypothetical protein
LARTSAATPCPGWARSCRRSRVDPVRGRVLASGPINRPGTIAIGAGVLRLWVAPNAALALNSRGTRPLKLPANRCFPKPERRKHANSSPSPRCTLTEGWSAHRKPDRHVLLSCRRLLELRQRPGVHACFARSDLVGWRAHRVRGASRLKSFLEAVRRSRKG